MHGHRAPALQLQDAIRPVWGRDLPAGGSSSDGAVVLGLAISADGLSSDALGGELMRRRRSRESGTQLAEFAVALPIIILLSLIAAEGANLFRVYGVVANASREGARLATPPWSSPAPMTHPPPPPST